MDVRVIAEIASPGMQHTHHADLPADIPRVPGQLLKRLGGSPKQDVVDDLLVLPRHLMQGGGQREGHHEVRHRQQQVALPV